MSWLAKTKIVWQLFQLPKKSLDDLDTTLRLSIFLALSVIILVIHVFWLAEVVAQLEEWSLFTTKICSLNPVNILFSANFIENTIIT